MEAFGGGPGEAGLSGRPLCVRSMSLMQTLTLAFTLMLTLLDFDTDLFEPRLRFFLDTGLGLGFDLTLRPAGCRRGGLGVGLLL